jgi:hypothetical protein
MKIESTLSKEETTCKREVNPEAVPVAAAAAAAAAASERGRGGGAFAPNAVPKNPMKEARRARRRNARNAGGR